MWHYLTVICSAPAYDQLTTRQKLFVDHYITCFNASKAAREAGYSLTSANTIGTENMAKPCIRQAIEEKLEEIKSRDPEITPEWLRETTRRKIKECDKPRDAFVGIELLGKMTPGTFEPVQQSGGTFNFLTILGKLGITTPGITGNVAQSLPPQGKQTPVVGGDSATDAEIVAVDNPVTPPDPLSCIDTGTPKNLQQKSKATTSVAKKTTRRKRSRSAKRKGVAK